MLANLKESKTFHVKWSINMRSSNRFKKFIQLPYFHTNVGWSGVKTPPKTSTKGQRWPFKVRILVSYLALNLKSNTFSRDFISQSLIISGCGKKGLGRMSGDLQHNFGSAINLLYDLDHHLASAVFIFLIYKIQGFHEVTSRKFSRSVIISWFWFWWLFDLVLISNISVFFPHQKWIHVKPLLLLQWNLRKFFLNCFQALTNNQ